ncbi:cytochrome b [Pusillimonas sp. CC-YST705]|uniref:Cytochrome b n=2 Tax=Mesopusillimonas faecipullorum TaxID=2755040 RepID=A0ABS8CFS8_9BURK|nr:cytochrome b [Mesopusillimonas faecipullorum]
MDAKQRYTLTARTLHWLMAVMLLGMLGLGFYMQGLPLSPQKLQIYSWHKWAGITVFLLAVLRLAWRVAHRPPALPSHMGRAAIALAHLAHGLLYALMLIIPLSGWLMSSAMGFQTVWFGVLPLPDLLGRDRELAQLLGQVHLALNWSLIVLVAGHVLAVLKHQFWDRDGILARMTFSFSRPR